MSDTPTDPDALLMGLLKRRQSLQDSISGINLERAKAIARLDEVMDLISLLEGSGRKPRKPRTPAVAPAPGAATDLRDAAE